MDGNFKDRVDKIFGSLSSSSSSSTPWSLSDAKVEKRVWNRDKSDNKDDDQTPSSSSFENLFSDRTKGLEDPSDEEGYQNRQSGGAGDEGDNDGDEWEIRSSIGLDSTLDNEEEEDAYDKMAEGRENVGDRLYMKDVTDHGPYLNSHNVLPSSVHDAPKHPRADHDAAKTRLKEDDAVGGKPGSPQASDEAMLNAEGSCVTVTTSEDSKTLKSILKRKRDATVKSAKRVRFDPTCRNRFIEEYEKASEENEDTLTGQSSMQLEGRGDVALLSESRRSVPDYILNPSKYTRYSFDCSHDVNEVSNTQACLSFLERVRKSDHVELEQKLEDNSSTGLPKSVAFVPRKKGSDGKQACSSEVKPKPSSTQAGSGVGIAAEEVQQGEGSSMMQEDELFVDAIHTKARLQKPDRQYRTKSEAEENVC